MKFLLQTAAVGVFTLLMVSASPMAQAGGDPPLDDMSFLDDLNMDHGQPAAAEQEAVWLATDKQIWRMLGAGLNFISVLAGTLKEMYTGNELDWSSERRKRDVDALRQPLVHDGDLDEDEREDEDEDEGDDEDDQRQSRQLLADDEAEEPLADVKKSVLQLAQAVDRISSKAKQFYTTFRPTLLEWITRMLDGAAAGNKTNEDSTSSARLFSFFKAPPPPTFPPLIGQETSQLDDSGAASGQQLYYDYSRLRGDVAYYSSVLDTIFTLLIALFAVLLIPMLIPVFMSLVAPTFLEDFYAKITGGI